MSGGKFDYWQHHINYIVESIEEIVNRQGEKKPASMFHYDFGKEPEFHETFSPEVDKKMREAISVLKRAYIYANRIDYFLSGDDCEESFLTRLKEELDEL
jgi:hemoglobin-like flavoprotein